MGNQTSKFDFANKFALLDSNVLRALLDATKTSSRFEPVLSFLKESNAFPYIIKRITDFEFVGFSNNKNAYNQLDSYINQFDGLPPDPKDFELAKKLSAMYKCANPSINPRQISFVDCLYAAQLLRVQDRAFIVTTDLNDYPSFLFDMPHHIALEESGGSTSFVGFKTFNPIKYLALQERFDRSA